MHGEVSEKYLGRGVGGVVIGMKSENTKTDLCGHDMLICFLLGLVCCNLMLNLGKRGVGGSFSQLCMTSTLSHHLSSRAASQSQGSLRISGTE